jgi:hypothetical protein
MDGDARQATVLVPGMTTTTLPTEIAPTTFQATVELMNHERCDRCGHRAYVMTVHAVDSTYLPLSWCAHHFHAHGPAMTRPRALLTFDVRELLDARETGVHA